MKNKNGYTLLELIITIMTLIVTPAMLILIGWIAWHFLAKYW
jgi:type II secretory pathway pseudopilin PulG